MQPTRMMQGTDDGSALPDGAHQELQNLSTHFAILAANLPAIGSMAAISPAPHDGSSQPPAVLNVMLTELAGLLARNDTAAVNLLEEHEATLRAALGPAYDTITSYVGKFDFEGARGAMKDSVKEMRSH